MRSINQVAHHYPLLKIAIMLILGMVAAVQAGYYGTPAVWFYALVVALLLAFALYRWAVGQSIMLLLLSFLLGGYLMSRSERDMQVVLPGTPIEYQAVVTSQPIRHGKVIQCDLMVVNMQVSAKHLQGEAAQKPMKVRASILCDTIAKRFEHLQVGDGIVSYSLLKPLQQDEYGSADYLRWLHSQGYQAQTFVYWSDWQKAAVPLASLSMSERTRLVFLQLRNRLAFRFSSSEVEEEGIPVLLAMFLGDKSQVTKSLRNDYSISGSSHILAISGLHLTILFGFLLFFFRRWRHHSLFLLLSLLLVWGYVVLVGMPSSAVRAAVMLSVCTVFMLFRRRSVSLNTLSFAAILMLVVRPLNLFDIGFQLSFAAVFAILIWVPLFDNLVTWSSSAWWSRPLRALYGLLAVSLAAQLGTAPLVAYYFGRFSCYFMLTNLVAIPLAYLILLLMLLVLFTLPVPALQSVFLSAAAFLASLLNTSMHAIAQLPGASIEHLHPSAMQVLLLYLLLLIFYFICRIVVRRGKRWK